MAQDVRFGANSKDPIVRIFRVKSDHTMLLKPKSVSDLEFAGIADAEFTSKIIGNIQVTPQDDGSNQIQFGCAAFGADLFDFINNYKNPTASNDVTTYPAFHGEEFGAGGAASSDDALYVSIHGPDDSEDAKIMHLGFLCTLAVANTGGFTIQPKSVIDVQLTFNQIKPKADLTIHDAAGTKSVLNNAIVDFTTENADIDLLTGSYKFHTPVAAV